MPRFTVTREGGRFTVSFDDGGMNLLSSDALLELRTVVDECAAACREAQHADACLLVFRSSHERVFAAGADMAEMERFTASEAAEFARLGQETFAAIEKLPLITVAIVDGDCFGGALDLVLAFDLRFATPRSRFSHPGAKLGIVTGFGGTSRWRRVIDAPSAARLFLGSPVLGAEEAREAGLVDVVGESFDEHLSRLAAADVPTVRLVKDLARNADRMTQSELLLLSQRLAALYDLRP